MIYEARANNFSKLPTRYEIAGGRISRDDVECPVAEIGEVRIDQELWSILKARIATERVSMFISSHSAPGWGRLPENRKQACADFLEELLAQLPAGCRIPIGTNLWFFLGCGCLVVAIGVAILFGVIYATGIAHQREVPWQAIGLTAILGLRGWLWMRGGRRRQVSASEAIAYLKAG